MLPYFINLAFVLLVSFVGVRGRGKPSFMLLGVGFFSMIFLAGLRDQIVGTDTRNYIYFYDLLQDFYSISDVNVDIEVGYLVLTWLLHFISSEYITLLFGIAIFYIGTCYWAILKLSVNIPMSIFVFITMGFYTFGFNGARQALAMGICFLAIDALQEKRFLKYSMHIFLAYFFHKSAIILCLTYFILVGGGVGWKRFAYLIAASLAFLSFSGLVSVAATFSEKYENYGVSTDGGGGVQVAFLSAIAIFFMLFERYVTYGQKAYNMYLNMYILGVLIAVLSVVLGIDPSGMLRLSLYFTFSAVLLWPLVFKNIRSNGVRTFAIILFSLLYLTYYAMTLDSFSEMSPYVFNRNLFN